MNDIPREIITAHRDDKFIQIPDWCRTICVHAKGGDAGTGDQSGDDGYMIIELFD